MRHSQKKETRKIVDKLLYQYAEYNKAVTEDEKNRIGDEMFYIDPIVWMMYKHEAYLGKKNEIKTVGNLREHCTDHGGICAKRFNFLSTYIKTKYGKDIRDAEIFPDYMPIEDLYDGDILNNIVQEKNFMQDWQRHEFCKQDEKVAKWQNYKY